jgi:DinB family protein
MDDTRWHQASCDHDAAVESFVAACAAIPAERWELPRAEGKWSPAQIAEHLRLTYATLRGELAGRGGFRVRVSRWRRLVLRLTVLRKILRQRAFPAGAPATREVRPGAGPFDRDATLAALRDEAAGLERELAAGRGLAATSVTHPFFGRLTPVQGLELCVAHTCHHRSHLEPLAVAAPPSLSGSPP